MNAEGFALVVDTSEFMRQLIGGALKEFFPKSVEAMSKDQAVAAMANKPGLAVIDLPADSDSCLDALGLLELLRKLDSEMPILCISAMEQAWIRKLAIRCGATSYMSKPFSEEELRRAVQGMIAVRA